MQTRAFIPAFSEGKELYFMFSLLEYEGVPVIFVCWDDDENLYLCDCVEFRNYQRWTISKTTAAILSGILNQTLSVYDALSLPGKCRVVELDYESNEYEQRMTLFKDLRQEELPQKGALLRYYDGRADSYVAMLNALSIKKEVDSVVSVSFSEANKARQYKCEAVSFKTGTVSSAISFTNDLIYRKYTKDEFGDCSSNLAFAA